MTNGNDPIEIAYHEHGGIVQGAAWENIRQTKALVGLTKREYFTASAIAAHSALIELGYPIDGIAKQCVLLADAIIKALNQPQP